MSHLFVSGGQSFISSSNEYSGLISFKMDWLDLLAVQGTLNSLLQHHSSKASILWRSAFFIVQLSHPYMTPPKLSCGDRTGRQLTTLDSVPFSGAHSRTGNGWQGGPKAS